MQHAALTASAGETQVAEEGSARLARASTFMRNDGAAFTLAELTRIAIETRIQACRGNKSRAAKSLGIALKTLYNRLAAYRAADAHRAAA